MSEDLKVGPEDALGTDKTKHDYSKLVRLESPHEMVATPAGEPNKLDDQLDRINKGNAPVDGTGPVPPGGDSDLVKPSK